MRVLGVDPGLTRCGLGIVDGSRGRSVSLIHVEVVRTPPHAELATRLLMVHRRVADVIEEFEPVALAVERVFSQANVSTVMGTAQAGGVAMLAAGQAGLPVGIHTPSEVKSAVTGSGRAGKDQVTTMVTHILGLSSRPTPADAADALALAICHLWSGTTQVIPSAGTSATPAQKQWAQARRAVGGARTWRSSR